MSVFPMTRLRNITVILADSLNAVAVQLSTSPSVSLLHQLCRELLEHFLKALVFSALHFKRLSPAATCSL